MWSIFGRHFTRLPVVRRKFSTFFTNGPNPDFWFGVTFGAVLTNALHSISSLNSKTPVAKTDF